MIPFSVARPDNIQPSWILCGHHSLWNLLRSALEGWKRVSSVSSAAYRICIWCTRYYCMRLPITHPEKYVNITILRDSAIDEPYDRRLSWEKYDWRQGCAQRLWSLVILVQCLRNNMDTHANLIAFDVVRIQSCYVVRFVLRIFSIWWVKISLTKLHSVFACVFDSLHRASSNWMSGTALKLKNSANDERRLHKLCIIQSSFVRLAGCRESLTIKHGDWCVKQIACRQNYTTLLQYNEITYTRTNSK